MKWFVKVREFYGSNSRRQSLKEGQRVTLAVTSGPKGPQAENVTPV
ncbi:cold shock domain-containing protein [Methylomonas lenta]|nr:cold shock domain-containing protein [Methylomonas lenta]